MPRTARNLANADLVVTSVRIERHKLARYRQIVEAEHRTVVGDMRHYIDARIAEADGVREEEAA